jgi:hypothetical protein
MDNVEKSSFFYYLASLSISLAKMTGDEEYAKQTRKTASNILDTILKKEADD